MDYFLTYEQREELVRLHLKAKQKAVDLKPKVIEVLKRFDGKQVNRRIDTALKAIDSNIYFKAQYNSVIISWFVDDRYIRTDHGVSYIRESEVTMAYGCATYSGRPEESCIIDGKLNADALIRNVESFAVEHCESIKSTLAQLPEVERLKARKSELEDAVNAHNSGIGWLLRQYFDLEIKQ